ncbi:MAG TPA: hypothetical protein VIS06_07250 [Mycobacteriales bacterium]
MPDRSADRGPMPLVASQFAALEPSWAGIRSSFQLRCLLILGALFNRRLYVHDTQLADNPHLLAEFRRHRDQASNLYTLLARLIDAGVVMVGLRDGTYDPVSDRLLTCDSLADLVRGWEQRDASSSWVIDPALRGRDELVGALDDLLAGPNPPLRYRYQSIKQDFMSQARYSFGASGGELRRLVVGRGADLSRRYEAILQRDWFSHSSIFALLRDAGLPLDDPLVQIHGMFDEASYAHWHRSRLLGCDWSTDLDGDPERLLGGAPTWAAPEPEGLLTPDALAERALRVVDGPGADLIGTLTAEEILELREFGGELFQLQELFTARSSADPVGALEAALVEASAVYWSRICAHLRRTRPTLSQQRTRIAIFLRRHLPNLALLAERFATVGLSSLVTVALDTLPGTRSLDQDTRRTMASKVSLDFVFFTDKGGDSDSLRALREAMPARTWVTPDIRPGNSSNVAVAGPARQDGP